MSESLREVADMLATRWVDLLGEQSDIIEVAEQPFEKRPAAFDLTSQDQIVDQPKAADGEGRFAARQAIAFPVAVDQAIPREPALDLADGGRNSGVLRRQKANQRQQQGGGIHGRAPERLDEGARRRTCPFGLDPLPDLISQGRPTFDVGWQVPRLRQLQGSIDGDPCHHL